MNNGLEIDCSVNSCLIELAHICSLCNDSSLEFNELRNTYEKVGEATETALSCLVEKMNVTKLDKVKLNKHELATVCNQDLHVGF